MLIGSLRDPIGLVFASYVFLAELGKHRGPLGPLCFPSLGSERSSPILRIALAILRMGSLLKASGGSSPRLGLEYYIFLSQPRLTLRATCEE